MDGVRNFNAHWEGWVVGSWAGVRGLRQLTQEFCLEFCHLPIFSIVWDSNLVSQQKSFSNVPSIL